MGTPWTQHGHSAVGDYVAAVVAVCTADVDTAVITAAVKGGNI